MSTITTKERIVKSKSKFGHIKEMGLIGEETYFDLFIKIPCYCGGEHGTPDLGFYTISQEEAELFKGLQKDDDIQISRKAGKIIEVRKLPAGSVVF